MRPQAALRSALAPFRDSSEHLLAELERIDLLIQARVQHARELHKQEDLQGLYISEQEVDDLLARPAGLPRWAVDRSYNEVSTIVVDRAAQNARRAAESIRAGVCLRLFELAQCFGLNPFEIDAVLICLAPEIDLRYERLYAYLQDDVTKKRPSVDLILNLLCGSLAEKLEARHRFGPGAPLLLKQILSVFEDPANPRATLLGRYAKLEDRMAGYLLGSDEPDPRLLGHVRLMPAASGFDALVLPIEIVDRFRAIAARTGAEDGLVLYLQGVPGTGRSAAAEAFCSALGVGLMPVNLESLLAAYGADSPGVLRCVMREALLQKAAIYCDGFEALDSPEHRLAREALMDQLRIRSGVTFLAGSAEWEPENVPPFRFLRVEFPLPGYSERLRIWQEAGGTAGAVDFAALAAKFRLTAGQIRAAAANAARLAIWRSPSDPIPGTADFHEACRLHSNRKLASLARRIKPQYSWNDIVLPSDRLEQLREVCSTLRHRPIVYEQWGFDRKLSLGKGLNVLFSGPSGTGKTMAAEILAGELELDLYKIDLSTVVSKYIGETEKNLSRIFAEAVSSNAILFFDEADALFGKRSEVRDAHDRYANIEINYLLQQMEEYEGMAILATNLRGNMDDAFVRRMHFAVEFSFPSAADRRRIWEGIWPADLPRDDGLDLDFLAESFELAGGNIRNIALQAAFLAADDGAHLTMTHLIRATRREYQKIGKIIGEEEFGDYAYLDESGEGNA